MIRSVAWYGRIAPLLICVAFAGCGAAKDSPVKSGGGIGTSADGKAVDPKPGDGTASEAPASGGTAKTPAGDKPEEQTAWEGYPDIPFVPIMTEINGIQIPRIDSKTNTLDLSGALPVDVGNEHAKAKPSKPERGDWLIVRFDSEPKSLNPIVETSAVQSYIGEYVQESLARLNPETMKYEPNTAEKWIVEDAVKLSPTLAGRERRVKVAGGEPMTETTLNYPAKEEGAKDDAKIAAVTTNGEGQPIGNTWIGLYAAEKIAGAPLGGYHVWSDAQGNATISGVIPGKYTVRVGAEVYGQTERKEDGSLVVTAAAPQNPLHEELKSTNSETLTLKKGEWTDVQAGTVFTFVLRKDVKWSDGAPFTTKDLQLGFAAINNNYVDGESLRVYYNEIVECNPLDDYTIRLKYRQQYFKAFEAMVGLGAQSPPWHFFEKIFQADGKTLTFEKLTPEEETSQKKVSVHGQVFGKFFNTDDRYNLAPLGTGPYVVGKWARGDRVEVTRNPNYWNQERAGYLDRIVFRFITDNVTAFAALKGGEIDFFWSMDAEQYHSDLAGPPDWFKQKYVKARWYVPMFGYVGWNMLRPMFQDQRVRVALGLLFDKQEFVEKKLYGDAEIVSGSEYYFGKGYDHAVKPLAYAPDVARELLADAGWVDSDGDGILDKDGVKFSFQYLVVPGKKIAEERAQILQRNLKDVGIEMDVRQYEWASFLDKIKSKDYDVVSLSWVQGPESDPFQIWHSSEAGPGKRSSNHVSFMNAEADRLIEQMRLTLDEKKRETYHFALHRILDREQPYMFLYVPMEHGAYHKRFRGVKWYRLRPGYDFTEWYVPKDEQEHKE